MRYVTITYMPDIRFDGDYKLGAQAKQQRYSRLTQFFIDKSFGLITTPSQAAVAQILTAIVFFAVAGYMFSKSGDTVVPTKTPQELINLTLPQNARN